MTQTYRLRASVLRIDVRERAVLLERTSLRFHEVDESGRILLDLLQAGLPADEVAAIVADATGEPVDLMRGQVDGFVSSLTVAGVVEEERPPFDADGREA